MAFHLLRRMPVPWEENHLRPRAPAPSGAAWLLGLIGAMTAGGAFAGEPVVLDRAQSRPPAQLVRDGRSLDLTADAALLSGDALRTGEGGRAAFVLAGGGYLSLGGGSELILHAVEPHPGARTVVKLSLQRGVMRVDPRQGEDLRLNAGVLRIRVLGADVWAGVEAAGDTVCLLRGAVEFQYAAGGGDRIDRAGECMFVRPGAAPLRYQPVPQVLAHKLRQADLGAASTAASLPAPPIVAERAAAASGRPAESWTVVVLSLSDGESAQLEAQSLRERGLDAHTYVEDAGGRRLHRVAIGRFDTREDARAFAARVKQRLHIEQAWVAPF